MQEMRSSEGGIGEEIQKLNVLIEPAEKELAELEALALTRRVGLAGEAGPAVAVVGALGRAPQDFPAAYRPFLDGVR